MRKVFSTFLAYLTFFVIFIGFNSHILAQNKDSNYLNEIIDNNNKFTINLFKSLNTNENLFVSPYSLYICFGMLYNGAKGETSQNIKQVFNFSMSDNNLNNGFFSLDNLINTKSFGANVTVNSANSLWIDKSKKLQSSFTNKIKKFFNGNIFSSDFINDFNGERLKINNMVESITNNKINTLIPEGVLNKDTRIVVVNAIYFKGGWNEEFIHHLTKIEDFYVNSNTTADVNMMHQESNFSYNETDSIQILKMFYKDYDYSMIVFLPKNIDGIKKLESDLTPENFKSWTSGLKPRPVKLSFPKFKLEDSFDLKAVLTNMGLGNIFTTEADFSGINGAKDLLISSVIQKTYINLDEEGTEASAATAISAIGSGEDVDPEKPVIFNANHPFIFAIVNEYNNAIIFIGKFTQP
ncbi:MAG: serpin family protein [Cyanobacteriota bacterium]